jgi:hypothetical protein
LSGVRRHPWQWLVGPAVVVCAAVLWVWGAGDATARSIRDVFAALDPETMLEVAAGLAVAARATRVAPWGVSAARRRDAASWLHRAGARVPLPVTLTIVVALAAGFRVVLGRANHLPKVLGDELVYPGLAKGWALHGQPLLRGSRDLGQSVLYPLFLAPFYRFAGDGTDALASLRAASAVVIALAAIPAFLLARRVVSRSWAIGVAALTVAGPWAAYSALTLTESLFYPLFVTYAAVLPWVLAEPTRRRQTVNVVLLATLVAVRAQALTIAAGTVAAIVLAGVLEGRTAVWLRRFAPTFAVFGLMLALGIAAAATGTTVPTSTYNVVFDSTDRIGGMVKWAAWNLGAYELTLGVALVPAVAVALSGMLSRDRERAVRLTGAVALTLVLGVLGSVALLSASPYGLGILHERNLFYVTPLLLTAAAYWLSTGLPRPFWLGLGAALAAVGLAASVPSDVVTHPNYVDAPSAAFFAALHGQLPGVPVRAWTIGAAAAGATVFLLSRRAIFPILTVVVAFTAVTAQNDYRDDINSAQAKALAWVDHALPPGQTATLVHLGLALSRAPCAAPTAAEEQDFVTWTEFFNRRIGTVAHVYAPNPRDGLASRALTVGPGGLVLDDGRPVAPAYLVIDSRQPIVGTRVRRFDLQTIHGPFQAGASLTLWRVQPPLRFYPRADPLPPRADGHDC